LTWAWLVALLGWTTLLCCYHLDGGARFEPIDCWVAQTAREMRDAGDWLVPRFSGETRMQKSPGPYWAVMLTSILRDTPVDEVSARIPNAVAAIILVATIFWLTRRIAGDRAAVFGGFAASASVLVLWWSHRGASDLGLTTCTTLALAALWIAAEAEPPGRKRSLLFLLGYFAAGLGMLWKMPLPLVLVGAPVLVYLLTRSRWSIFVDRVHLIGLPVYLAAGVGLVFLFDVPRAMFAAGWLLLPLIYLAVRSHWPLLGNRVHLVGLGLFLLPWLPWAIAVSCHEPNALAKWKVEFLDRFTGNLPSVKGQRAWYYHFIYLLPPLLYCLPFSLSLPQAFARAFRRRPGVNRDGTLFLAIWFLSHFVFFTAAAGKELRYFLPALPPLFVLLGMELAAFFSPARTPTAARDRLGARAVWIGVPLAFIGGAFALRFAWFRQIGSPEDFAWREVWPPYAVAAVIFSAGAALAAWFYLRRREHASFGALVGTMWLTWAWVWPQVMPVFMSQRSFLDFAKQLQQRIDPGRQGQLRQIGSQDSRITWYSDYRFPRLIDQLDLLGRQGGRRSEKREREIYGREMLAELSGPVPVLLVASRPYYVDFLLHAPLLAAAEGRPMPDVYLWVQTQTGRQSTHYVVFGNRPPPPWPEPELQPPSERLQEALASRASAAPTTPGTASAPTTRSTRPTTTPGATRPAWMPTSTRPTTNPFSLRPATAPVTTRSPASQPSGD
jgi:4-amino-4-deoxy-L-arabinose transferase-like glycosyltransferase